MASTKDSVELMIPAKPEYVGVARLTTSGIASRMGYSYDDIEDIKVAVSEACTNAVNHAYKDGEDGQIAIHIKTHENCLEIRVIDRGNSFNTENLEDVLKPVDPNMNIENINEGGLGLFLIDTLMDEVNIHTESGVNVFMKKFLNRDEVESYVDRVPTD